MAPLPQNKSKNRAPVIFELKILNKPSLARSAVGRVAKPQGATSGVRFAVPAITRMVYPFLRAINLSTPYCTAMCIKHQSWKNGISP
jgi:hypothetical protein